jgi:hypothetical protein
LQPLRVSISKTRIPVVSGIHSAVSADRIVRNMTAGSADADNFPAVHRMSDKQAAKPVPLLPLAANSNK